MSNSDISVKKVGNMPSESEMPTQKAGKNIIPTMGNKALYIVVVEDPLNDKSKTRAYRWFGTAKPEKNVGYVEFVGYDITEAQIEQLKTYDDVLKLAAKGEVELVNAVFPWQRVVNIKNITFSLKDRSA